MLKKSNWPAILWALFILVICGIPGNQIPKLKYGLDLFADKVVHALTFAILVFLVLWKTKQLRSKAFAAIFLCSLYGAIIEILQKYLFINRSCDWLDWLADTLGAVAGWLVLLVFLKRRK